MKWHLFIRKKPKHVCTVKGFQTLSNKLFFPSNLIINRSQFISVHRGELSSTSCCHVHKNSVFVDSSRRVMMYCGQTRLPRLREDRKGSMCSRSNPRHVCCFESVIETHGRARRCKICIWATTTYVRSQERFAFLQEANKSGAGPQGREEPFLL